MEFVDQGHVCHHFVCFVALRPKSTAMVIAGRSVHLTTLFDGVGMELATPGSAVRHASVARHVTHCATGPGCWHWCHCWSHIVGNLMSRLIYNSAVKQLKSAAIGSLMIYAQADLRLC